jgi:transcriptional regulator GlxA family with amidase domain
MNIVLLAPQGVQSLDVVGPAEAFWEAARRLGNPDAYRVQVMGTSGEPIRGTGALRFLPDRTIQDPDQPIDTLLVAGDRPFRRLTRPLANGWRAGRRRAGASARSAPGCFCSRRPGCSTANR